MARSIWVGFVEVRQLPGSDHPVKLTGKGAFTWVSCWADDGAGYLAKVCELMSQYGLFVVEAEQVMPFLEADQRGLVSDELAEQVRDTEKDENFCIFGTLHSYMKDES